MKYQIDQSGKIEQTNKRGRIKLSPDELRFGLVGKGSNAHGVASKAFRAKRADFSASKENILSLILLYER